MPSVQTVRIPGLATGMDTDSVIKDMLTSQQNKIDKAKQKEQTIKWQQEKYRDIIKDIKGLSDKYFTAVSKDYILSSKAFSTMKVDSSNSSVVSATAAAGASEINYKIKVDKVAQPPRVESKISKDETLVSDYSIEINGKPITLKTGDTVSSVIEKINKEFPEGEVKARYSEMTGTFIIEGQKTGISSELSFGGDAGFFTTMGISTNTVTGTNSEGTVYASDGISELKKFTEESNSFTIDNITYNVNGVSDELISMTSQTDTSALVEKMKTFIDDYNKVMDKIYGEIIEKKNLEFPPLTDAQKEEMSEEEIKNWEEKAKNGILRNDSELRKFMEDTKQALFGPIEGMGISLIDIGITSSENYNDQGQISLDEEKFKKALLQNGDQIYQALTKTATDKSQSGSLERMKDTFYKYVGNSNSIFAKKAGIEKTASVAKNLFGEQIQRQQENIKNLQRKMDEKEKQLYKKFAALEASMNKFNSQMNYLLSQQA